MADDSTTAVDHGEWSGPVAAGVQIGGTYVENPDFVPHATDVFKQYKTSGTGAHEQIEEVSPIFAADKQTLAVEAARALDPEDKGIPRTRVILPDDTDDNEAAIERVQAAAQRAKDNPVVVGGPSPAEQQAALSGPRGEFAASSAEVHKHSAVASPRRRTQHDTGATVGTGGIVTPPNDVDPSDADPDDESGTSGEVDVNAGGHVEGQTAPEATEPAAPTEPPAAAAPKATTRKPRGSSS